ncbi:MAG: dihydroxy-acid dehydratase [Clostridiales Family XIII bacterium]|nr:dihydroxy-acid dehydratase [Clostridiales Family XIII bacterium]
MQTFPRPRTTILQSFPRVAARACEGAVAVEVYAGGIIALAEDGDVVGYTIPDGSIERKVPDAELARRRAA